ncbi:MAG: FecR domain-containing protein [Bacteroidetes bacterium]|nr:FecR domain-containing protein [Bacteroidota bacterium]
MAAEERPPAQRIIYLVSGYINSRLTADEQRELDAWINQNDHNRQLFAELVSEDRQAAAIAKMESFGTEQSLLHVTSQMAAITQKHRQRIKYSWYAAAAILVFSAVALFTHTSHRRQLLTVSVPFGKVQQLTLPDSSKVWLNAGTTIQYPEKFDNTTRQILLKNGQAFFDVVHDPDKPFVVEAKGIDVTVLGTSFEVKAFADEQENKVAVTTGKVGVSAKDQPTVMLLPDESAVYNTTTHQISEQKTSAADIASWRTGRLVFEQEPFQYVIHALERKYNVRIQNEKPQLLQLKITLRLNDQPLKNVLDVLAFSNNFNYRQENEQLIVIR